MAEEFKPLGDDSPQLLVTLINTTTNMPAKKNAMIRFILFQERGIVLEVPRSTCAEGHSLTIAATLILPGEKKKLQFNATTKVAEVKEADKANDRIAVNLVQYDEKTWMTLQGVYSNRQEEVETFLKAARGR